MRFSIAILAVATSVSATALVRRDYPTCALPCLVSPDIGSCDSINDLSCVCKSATFISSVSACFDQVCSGDDLNEANETARQACAAVGVTITAVPTPSPSATPPAQSATSPSSASSPASSSSSAAPSPTSQPSSAELALSVNVIVGAAAVAGAFFTL